ncbi:MAG: tail fiber domain-containing protein, partial [Bdellovibrionales bacterium]|nr:tail fiber domain-containing protein [Bdellovibrionales bacterium]
ISMPPASSSVSGYLTTSDWNTFYNKQAALGFTPINKAGDSISSGIFTLSGSAVLRSPDPIGLTDVANKQYVDARASVWTVGSGNAYRTTGKIGVGTASPVGTIDVQTSSTATAFGYGYGVKSQFDYTPASAGGLMLTGSDSTVNLFGSNSAFSITAHGAQVNHAGSGILTSLNGSTVALNNNSSGTAINVSGISSTISNTSTGVIGAGVALDASIKNLSTGWMSSAIAGRFSVTTPSGHSSSSYGVYIGTVEGLIKHSLYVSDANAPSYFAGKIGVGVTAPTTELQVAGIISPEADATRDLGTSLLRFKDIYASNNVIQTSDGRLKKDVLVSDLGLDFINSLRPVSYKWIQGDDSKLHYGLIAQEAQGAIALAKTKMGKTDSDDVENVIVAHDKVSDRYGVRYTELIAPLIKATQEFYTQFKNHLKESLVIESRLTLQERRIASSLNRVDILEKENRALKSRIEKIEELLINK